MPAGPDGGQPLSFALPAILTGVFTLIGGLGGVLLTGSINRRNEVAKQRREDDRRWLEDRRKLYAEYLGLAEDLLQEIDGTAIFLAYDQNAGAPSEEDKQLVDQGVFEFRVRLDEELEPALRQVQLIASADVVDLAGRVSAALSEVAEESASDGYFMDHVPWWFKTQEMIHFMRNAMREELGISALPSGHLHPGMNREDKEWPWLPAEQYKSAYAKKGTRRPGATREDEEGVSQTS
ncbi:hypothetical protein [Actinomycetospora sp. CA-053990]|uniref:hypothetical protein n=1 Tax=Actinomycetospora sp. CA-053990 TaxID=3239891 RepID=UPI003D8D4C4F